jgi:hypothetical protein
VGAHFRVRYCWTSQKDQRRGHICDDVRSVPCSPKRLTCRCVPSPFRLRRSAHSVARRTQARFTNVAVHCRRASRPTGRGAEPVTESSVTIRRCRRAQLLVCGVTRCIRMISVCREHPTFVERSIPNQKWIAAVRLLNGGGGGLYETCVHVSYRALPSVSARAAGARGLSQAWVHKRPPRWELTQQRLPADRARSFTFRQQLLTRRTLTCTVCSWGDR